MFFWKTNNNQPRKLRLHRGGGETGSEELTWQGVLDRVKAVNGDFVVERGVSNEIIWSISRLDFPKPNLDIHIIHPTKWGKRRFSTRQLELVQLNNTNRPWVGQWDDVKPVIARRPPADSHLPGALLRLLHGGRRSSHLDRFYRSIREIRDSTPDQIWDVGARWLLGQSFSSDVGEGRTTEHHPPVWYIDDYIHGLRGLLGFLDPDRIDPSGQGTEELRDQRSRMLYSRLYTLPNSDSHFLARARESELDTLEQWQSHREIYQYIVDFWERSLRYRPFVCRTGKGVAEPMPYPFMVPNGVINEESGEIVGWFDEAYRWDTYFQNLGIEVAGGLRLARQQYLNLASLFYLRGRIPNASLMEFQTHSQPPIEAAGVMRLMRQGLSPESWSDLVIEAVGQELFLEWFNPYHTGSRRINREIFEKFGLVSKHGTLHFNNELVGSESGYDHDYINTTYGENLLSFPLQCNLYLQADEIANYHRLCGDEEKAGNFRGVAEQIRQAAQAFWVGEGTYAGFRDIELHYESDELGSRTIQHRRLATECTALWSGIATADQARVILNNLRGYEGSHGLAASHPDDVARLISHGEIDHVKLERLQWEAPNMWAPQMLQAIWGCLRYSGVSTDFSDYALQLSHKWVAHLETVFNHQSIQGFKEKYAYDEGVDINPGFYGQETGFGWTIGVYLWVKRFLLLSQKLDDPKSAASALGVEFVGE